MHGRGDRRICGECNQPVKPEMVPDLLGYRELRGPRNITSSNIDRAFDDDGQRCLVIEEKRENEDLSDAQLGMLRSFACRSEVEVWLVLGNPDRLEVQRVYPDGKRVVIASGDFAAYQSAVWDWFEQPAPDLWDRLHTFRLTLIAAGPDWCPADAYDAMLDAIKAFESYCPPDRERR